MRVTAYFFSPGSPVAIAFSHPLCHQKTSKQLGYLGSMVVVGKHFVFLLLIVLLPFQRQPRQFLKTIEESIEQVCDQRHAL